MNPLVLIVDDDPFSILLMKTILDKSGFFVHAYESGIELLDNIKIIKPDIVLLDIKMVDVDGYEVCRRMKSDPELKDIPVMFVTGASEMDEIVAGFEAGAVDYVLKPIHKEELLARIKNQLIRYKLQRDLEQRNSLLEDSENRFKSLFKFASIGIIITNARREITLANPYAEGLFGYSHEELIGSKIDILIEKEKQSIHAEKCKDFTKNPHSRHMGENMDITGIRKDGKKIPLDIELSSFSTSYGELYISYVQDITERREAEKIRDQLVKNNQIEKENLEEKIRQLTKELRNHKTRGFSSK